MVSRAQTGVDGFGDTDAFYASAEVVRRPWLAGLPIGVLGNQGAAVIARSYASRSAAWPGTSRLGNLVAVATKPGSDRQPEEG